MKRLFCFLAFAIAFIGNTLAWEPVIKERHWFGVKEYESELYTEGAGVGPRGGTIYNNGDNEITSIVVEREYSNSGTHKYHTSTFNCWMDDSANDPKPRFKLSYPNNWEIGTNSNSNYTGLGLKVKDLGNDNDGHVNGTIIHIQHLNNGDKLVFEMYCVPGGNYNILYMPFLEEGSIEGVPALNYADEWSWDGANNIGNADGVSNEYTYTGSDDGTIKIKVPSNTVIRCITIIYNDNNYKKATTRIDEIHDSQNNKGYEMTITGSGVLEDKRGAVPYLTMRYGAENDMTVSKYLGTVNGEKLYATSSIVDESEILDPNNVQLQSPYRNRNEAQNQKSLVGKEITVFTANESLSDPTEAFNSIYPLYGNYYYFFPEVDGKFHVKFYCEGGGEHMCLWYKLDNGVPVPANDQVTLTKLKISTDGGNNWTNCGIGGENSTLNQNYYEYTAEFKKGGVYYMCSNPTVESQQTSIPRLISYSFIPSFRVDPLYNVVENGTTACTDIATVYGGEFSDLLGDVPQDEDHYITINGERQSRVKCVGNVKSATPYFYADGGNLKLGFKDIEYKYKPGDDTTKDINKGGAIIVHIDCAAGRASFVLTIAYKAEEAEWVVDTDGNKTRMATDKNKEEGQKAVFVKCWDFFSGKGDKGDGWDLGKYSEGDESKLWNEINKADGLTADWVNTYVNLKEEEEPIFKSVYDMEGDNADMIHETAGLLFHVESNLLGIYNENEASTSSFADRYIGLMGPGSLPLDNGQEQHPRALTIPKLTVGDRIAIKMGCYGNVPGDETDTKSATLTITGANDAVGNAITGDYKIGGSGVNIKNGLESDGFDDLSKPYGEYHFISSGGDFTLQVKDADLLKIYSIAIYRNAANDNADILTENSVAAEDDKRYILNVPENDAKDHAYLHINYRGENEPTKFHQETRKTGNITAADIVPDASESSNDMWYNYSVNNDKFGIFKTRLGVKTTDEAYVTDYADCMIPVGYRETKEYPYTWDFTDLKAKYVSAGISTSTTETETSGNEKGVSEADLRIWNEWGFRSASDEYDGYIFAPGGQLYGGTTMFDESRGIGITHNGTNNTMSLTGSADVDGGLSVSDEFGFVVPQVKAGQAVYVHTTGNGTTAQYAIGNGTKQDLTAVGTNAFAMQMADNATTANVTLYFKGYEVNKIAVATDSKKVNSKGWTSESRDHAIDASLLPYFTGKGLKTYVVSDPDYTTRTLTLTDVGAEANYVIPASTGCLIYNTDNGEFNPFGTDQEGKGDGFHLFVPDMHDQEGKASELDNLLIANVDKEPLTLGMFDGDKVNYVLAYKYQLLKSDGTPYGDIIEGPEMFYRVSNKSIKLHKNSAYLQLPKDMVMPSTDNPTGSAKFTFFFAEPSETTSIEAIESLFGVEIAGKPATWYNLNGQKLNGKPTKGGLYIVNGKKVLVK